mmetsp:Transcript_69014/g.138793  ORF Transcript_69014/g.138793 Transcript_69014/m.138793 type:complete len:256 (-) Transcript_69014:131-898(-)
MGLAEPRADNPSGLLVTTKLPSAATRCCCSEDAAVPTPCFDDIRDVKVERSTLSPPLLSPSSSFDHFRPSSCSPSAADDSAGSDKRRVGLCSKLTAAAPSPGVGSSRITGGSRFAVSSLSEETGAARGLTLLCLFPLLSPNGLCCVNLRSMSKASLGLSMGTMCPLPSTSSKVKEPALRAYPAGLSLPCAVQTSGVAAAKASLPDHTSASNAASTPTWLQIKSYCPLKNSRGSLRSSRKLTSRVTPRPSWCFKAL